MKKLLDIGERAAIQLILDNISKGDVAVGPGDDCSAIEFEEDYLLISTDMISQKTHIPKEMTPFQTGWFIVAINLSDIAAKGGKPLGIVLTFGLPKDKSEEYLKNLVKGADKCATQYGTSIIGGDMKENPNVVFSGTALGIVKKNDFMSRKGTQPGDVVTVTGSLGKAAAGYYVLKHNLGNKKILKGLFEPHPRLNEGMKIAKAKIVTSCMDLSDGLSSSLYQLQELNHVGFEIETEKIPISQDLIEISQYINNLDANEISIHSGGDYELLLTVSPDNFEKAKKIIKNLENVLTPIGTVIEENKIVISHKGKKKILKNKGYEHFKDNNFW